MIATTARRKPAAPAITTPAVCGAVKIGGGDAAAAVFVADLVGEVGVAIVFVAPIFDLIVNMVEEALAPLLTPELGLSMAVLLIEPADGEVCKAF